jgi:hypothetical protein
MESDQQQDPESLQVQQTSNKSNYILDGDQSFIGLNSRDNPISLRPSMVSKSQNMRLEKGTAVLRKGALILDTGDIRENDLKILGSCVFEYASQKYFVFATVSGVYKYEPESQTLGDLMPWVGVTVDESTDVRMYQGNNYIYINLGLYKYTLRFGINDVELSIPDFEHHENYPNSIQGLYFGNRHIVQDSEQSIAVSYYLQDNAWSSLDQFTINSGNGDKIVAITPWQLNEFLIFSSRSIHYASVGIGAVAAGGEPKDDNSYIKSMATDIGCIAPGSIVQAGGSVFFLSTNGLYILDPSGVANGKGTMNTPEGMRLVTISKPLSSEIDDIIQRININNAHKSAAVYWNNRYYLALPLNNEDGTENTYNNNVIVFNFITKKWESVDKYPDDYNIKSFFVFEYNNKNRLFAVDENLGLLLLEEGEFDSTKDIIVGTPFFNYNGNSATLGDESEMLISYGGPGYQQIAGELITRGYLFNSTDQKRISNVQSDCYMKTDDELKISLICTNPDSETSGFTHKAEKTNDVLFRFPVKKLANSVKVKFEATNNTPEIRNVYLKAIKHGESTHTKR